MSQQIQKALFYKSDKRSLYLGRVERELTRVNVTSALMLSIDGHFDLTDSKTGESHHTRSVLVPAGKKITINTNNSHVAICFLDDLGVDLAKLIPRMSDSFNAGSSRVYTNIRYEEDMIYSAEKLWAERAPTEQAIQKINSWVEYVNITSVADTDPRVEKAVRLIKDKCNENISVSCIADEVCLSVPRLTQLFKQVTGTPIRRFRLWHRIYRAAEKVQDGMSLTEAAIEAGFADYSQFSRVYRELGGGSPSAARNNTEIRMLAS